MSSEALDAWKVLMKELNAEDLTKEQWLLLVDRAEVIAEGPGGLWEMLEPIIFVGDRRGWEHPRHQW